jgi:hypothetical protein
VITIQFEQRFFKLNPAIVRGEKDPVDDGCLNNASLSDANEGGSMERGR